MKYGKLLDRARRLSNPAWKKYWLNYGELKVLIGLIAVETGGPEAKTIKNMAASNKVPDTPTEAEETNDDSARSRIANLPTERQFFADLKKNLEIVSIIHKQDFPLKLLIQKCVLRTVQKNFN